MIANHQPAAGGSQAWSRRAAFVPDETSVLTSIKRAKVFVQHLAVRPAHAVIKPARGGGDWALYFAYSPSGMAFDQHRFSIDRLQQQGFKVLLVLGTSAIDARALDGWPAVDALILKELHGFDFSGYQIGLHHLAHAASPVNVLVMNDSVFGPFTNMRRELDTANWRITGFTSSRAVENHIQSYAFHLRHVDAALMMRLSAIFFPLVSLNHHGAVTYLQETRLARVASRQGGAGILWMPNDPAVDLPMAYPFDLLEDGFPFMKRSILGKFSADFSRDRALTCLHQSGHPVQPGQLFDGFMST